MNQTLLDFIKLCTGKLNNGTAFLIDSTHALTARHVIKKNIEDNSKIIIEFKNSKLEECNISGTVIDYIDESIDVALIKLDKPVVLSNYLEVSTIGKERKEEWGTFGFPESYPDTGTNFEGTISDASVINNNKGKLFYDTELSCEYYKYCASNYESYIPGLSGAPVVINSKVQGIIKLELDKKLGAISSDLFIDLLKKNEISINTQSSEQSVGQHLLTKICELKKNSNEHYEQLKSINGRFKYLNINELILPNPKTDLIDVKVKLDTEDIGIISGVMTLWNNECRHGVISGEGGMGKTVSLITLWKHFLNTDDVIPIYIELNEYNNIEEGNKKHFIIQMIRKYYLKKSHLTPEDENIIWDILMTPRRLHNSFYPSVILLLDGFNEITEEKRNLLLELNDLFERAKGTQILITSRYDMRSIQGWSQLNKLELQGLKKEQITEYLKHYPEVNFDESNKTLVEIVKNPMMLTLYTASCEIMALNKESNGFSFKQQVYSSAEILWNFIESQIVKCYQRKCDELEKCKYEFYFRHLLPSIAFSMESKGKYYFSLDELNEVINETLSQSYEAEFINVFSKFVHYLADIDYIKVQGIYKSKKLQDIARELTNEMNMLISENDNYRFLHQHFRDFFAAIKIINAMELCIKSKSIEKWSKAFDSNPISIYIRRFIGEIEGEHYNKPRFIDGIWRYDKQLDSRLNKIIGLYRKKFDKNIEYSVWNIIQIWKEVRGELSGEDLSFLNLRGCNLNNVICSRVNRRNPLITNFQGAQVSKSTFISQGHSGPVERVEYTKNTEYIVSESIDGHRKFWNINTGECIYTCDASSSDYRYKESDKFDNKKLTSFDHVIMETNESNGNVIKEYRGHTDLIICLSYSNDGQFILSGAKDNTAKLWSVTTGECLHTFKGHKFVINSVVISSDNKKVLTASSDMSIKEWDVDSEQCIKTYLGHSDSVNTAVYSIDERKILSASVDKSIKEWDTQTGECICTFSGKPEGIKSISCDDMCNYIAFLSEDDNIKIWNLKSGICEGIFSTENEKLREIYYSKCSQFIIGVLENSKTIKLNISTGVIEEISLDDSEKLLNHNFTNSKYDYILDDQILRQIDKKTGELNRLYNAHRGSVNNININKKLDRLVSASDDYSIIEWNYKDGKYTRAYLGHQAFVNHASYNTVGTRILSASLDHTIREWDTQTGECLSVYKGHKDSIFKAIYIKQDSLIVSISKDKSIRIWDTTTQRCLTIIKGHRDWVMDLYYNDDDETLITTSKDNTIKEWDLKGNCIFTYSGHTSWVTSIDFDTINQRILTASFDGTIREWDYNTKKQLRKIQSEVCLFKAKYNIQDNNIIFIGQDNNIYEVGVNMDGYVYKGHNGWVFDILIDKSKNLLISASEDNTIKLWDMTTKNCNRTFEWHSKGITKVIFRKDLSIFTTSSQDGLIKEWDINTGNCIKTYTGHYKGVTCIKYNRDYSILYSGSEDRQIIEWNTKTGKQQRVFKGHLKRINCLDIDESNNKIISGSESGELIEWDLKDCSVINTINLEDEINELMISPDGKNVLCVLDDISVLVLDIVTKEKQREFRDISGLNIVGCNFRDITTNPSDGNYLLKAFKKYGGVVSELN